MPNHFSTTSSQTFAMNESGEAGRKRRFYIFCVASVFLALLGGFILGYFIPRSCGSEEKSSTKNIINDRTFEKKLLSTLDSKSIESISRSFSSQPHLAGSQRNLDLGLEIEKKWKEFGFDEVTLPTYDVLLSYPKANTASKVEIFNNNTEQVLYESLPHYDDNGVPVFLAYSSSGVVKGRLVYVNYGTKEDYDELQKHNISLNGNIAIARYGKIFRGSKVAMASQHGAVGVLLYPDPINFSPFNNDYYPRSWWLPPNATQRGSVYPGPSFGDPLTHGLPSTAGMYRNKRNESNLPTIPAHVLTYGEALHFLSRMTGPEVPSKWRGGLSISYRFGPGFKDASTIVRLNVTSENIVKQITNVIGTIKGSIEPDRIVLIGSHRDSWVYGAVDGVTATSVIMELSRALGVLLKSGWRPRRTIKFCSWSAEEYALIGSTEWVEENSALLSQRAVAYLNMDLAVCGNYTLRTFSSPLLNQLIVDAAHDVIDPTSDLKQTIYDVMLDRDPAPGGMAPNLRTLGTISDYASFYQYLGIPSIDWGYYFLDKRVQLFPYPAYHSSVETFQLVKDFIDPEFKIHLAVAQLGGIFLMRLVDSPLLPMYSVSNYSHILQKHLRHLKDNTREQLQMKNISFMYLEKAIEDFGIAAIRFEDYLKGYKTEKDFTKLRILNDQIQHIEKLFLYSNGLPGRNEFKHLIFAPSLYNTYASTLYPGIADAVIQCQLQNSVSDCDEVRRQISLTTNTIRQATTMLKPIL